MECNPAEYIRRDEHTKLCDERHDGAMDWAKSVVKTSEEDRKDLWLEVTELKKISGKIQTWFIVILCTCIIAPIVVNKWGKNGETEYFKRQYNVSKANDRNIEAIMKYLGLPYMPPQEYPPEERR